MQRLSPRPKALCAEAQKLGMTVELEVFDYDVDKKSLIGPTLYAKQFAEEIRKEYANFGLLIDLSHFPLIHESVRESVLPVRDLITHVHIGNAVATPERSPMVMHILASVFRAVPMACRNWWSFCGSCWRSDFCGPKIRRCSVLR